MSQSTMINTNKPGGAYPPGPKGLPILGNALQMGDRDIIHSYMELYRQYGEIVHVKLGPLHGYMLFNAEDVHHVLVKNAKNYIKGLGYNGLRLLVGNGILTSDGEFWRQQRRLVQPSFTPKGVAQFSEMMVEVTEALLARWAPLASRGEAVVMDQEMLRLTMSVIGRAMFSIDLGEQMLELGEAFERAFGFIPSRTNSMVPLSLPLPSHRVFKRDLALINRFIDERVRAGRQDGGQENMLNILLQARDEETGRGMTAEQLRDEVVTLFFAGFETTARTLTWGWYLLAQHPDVQAKLQKEADRVLGERLPSLEDLEKLGYTRQVIDETLRLYPPTALLARQNIEQDEIGGYAIPPGSMVILVPYHVHRDPRLWPDPERFDPERFNEALSAERPKYAHIPFAAGPRICVGNNFALMEMIYAFAMAAQCYRVQMVEDEEIPFIFAGTMRPLKPLRVRLQSRQ